jgi:hypothetical protein
LSASHDSAEPILLITLAGPFGTVLKIKAHAMNGISAFLGFSDRLLTAILVFLSQLLTEL